MSVHVATEFRTKPQYADGLVAALTEALPDSINHEGCQAISLRRNQDDATNIVSFTRWATRQHYEDYLAWRTEHGMTDDIGELLTEPMTITYFDEVVAVNT
jgi:quinol monooxygenase YgiN